MALQKYPRVLMVVAMKVKAKDPYNLLIRTQFGNWPKECLAQIYSGDPPGEGEFCGRCYQIAACDRFLGKLFLALRARTFSMVAMEKVAPSATNSLSPSPSARWAKVFRNQFGHFLINSGIWEALFQIRISKAVTEFIEDFRPDIIYCNGYSLAFATLPLLVSTKFNIPVCFQTLEDWPSYSYRYSPIGAILRRQARLLISQATLRLAFGEKMHRIYEKRYKVPFLVTYHMDDMHRFKPAEPNSEKETKRIIFSGSLVLNRHECIEDLLSAVRLIQSTGTPIKIEVYCTGLPKDLSERVRLAPEVTFMPIPPHEDLPQILHKADILFLPESFTVGERRLDLAISTKCHLYMMAGRPILVYGPAYGGTMQYARQQGWALVVQQRDIRALAGSIRRLLDDATLGAELVREAAACFRRNHDVNVKREQFEQLIEAAAATGQSKAGLG